MFDSNTFGHALLSIFRTLYSFHGLHGVKLVSAGGDAPTKFSKTEGVGVGGTCQDLNFSTFRGGLLGKKA